MDVDNVFDINHHSVWFSTESGKSALADWSGSFLHIKEIALASTSLILFGSSN
jgi:hypothetical protein